ncbi:MAG: hypothetical protein ACE5WD_05445 [Candidatus Aminicenantia bacterium]
MLFTKRVIIATIFGVIFGIICWLFARSEGTLAWYISLNIILSRTLIGFAIGISSWRIPWWLHGILLGFIFSLPMAFGGFVKGWSIFSASLILGVIYGFLIELFTSIVFKAKMAT